MARLTPKQFEEKLKRYAKKQPALVERALEKGVEQIRREVTTKHLGQPRTSTQTGRNAKNATLRTRSGDLIGSITSQVQARGKKIYGRVGSGLKGKKSLAYAAIHERGGRAGPGRKVKIPARPYLVPSLQERKDEAIDKILNELIKGYQRT